MAVYETTPFVGGWSMWSFLCDVSFWKILSLGLGRDYEVF